MRREGLRLESVPALIEVNISGKSRKLVSGLRGKGGTGIGGQFKSLRIYGLMTMAPLTGQAELSRPIFRELYSMQQQLSKNNYTNVELKYLSMGMSDDFEVAIEESANIVRIGTALLKNKDRVEDRDHGQNA